MSRSFFSCDGKQNFNEKIKKFVEWLREESKKIWKIAGKVVVWICWTDRMFFLVRPTELCLTVQFSPTSLSLSLSTNNLFSHCWVMLLYCRLIYDSRRKTISKFSTQTISMQCFFLLSSLSCYDKQASDFFYDLRLWGGRERWMQLWLHFSLRKKK